MKIFKYLLILLIIAFLGLYFAYSNGYSEKIIGDKVVLTNEMIEEFENDILEGNDISLENYLTNNKDLSTKTSNFSLKISSKLENIVDNSIKFIFRKLSNMVE